MSAWTPDADCETHEWRNPLGETIRFVTRVEARARMMPPVTITTIRVPQAQGGRFRGARHEMRLVTLPVVVPGAAVGRDETRRWARALDPLKGEGTLTVVQGDHAGRQLVCVYEAGLDEWVEEGVELLGLTTIAFRAADPYWQDSNESATTARIGAAYSWFPFAGSWAQQPLVLGAANIFAAITVDNVGDVDSWPVITAIGPGSELTVRNDSTGETTHITGAIAAASTVVIDTRPGHKTVTVDGFNAFGRLDATSSLWPLIPGPNRISITFTNATVAASVAFTWRNRWLAA